VVLPDAAVSKSSIIYRSDDHSIALFPIAEMAPAGTDPKIGATRSHSWWHAVGLGQPHGHLGLALCL
jgi:hypothetical protein